MAVALPIISLCSGPPYTDEGHLRWKDTDYTPGRIVLLLPGDEDPNAEVFFQSAGDWDWLGKNDIVHVPLYRGYLSAVGMGQWPPTKLDAYDDYITAIQEIAPHCRGIIMGNQAAELSYWPSESIRPMNNVITMCAFVNATAPIVSDAGGMPWYGTMDWSIIHDCYEGNWQLLKTVNNYGGGHVCFCGFTLMPGTYYDIGHPQYRGEQEHLQVLRWYEPEPFNTLKEYIHSGTFITGVRGCQGLIHGNDRIAKEYGFIAGETKNPNISEFERYIQEHPEVGGCYNAEVQLPTISTAVHTKSENRTTLARKPRRTRRRRNEEFFDNRS